MPSWVNQTALNSKGGSDLGAAFLIKSLDIVLSEHLSNALLS